MEAFFRRSSERVMGNEAADEAHDRFAGSVRSALASTPAESTVVVAHGAVISLLVGRANRLDPYGLWRVLGFTSFVVVSTPSFEMEEVVHAAPG
jgi:broad specificity phosphatase PhoE